jgi:hypothetical protein
MSDNATTEIDPEVIKLSSQSYLGMKWCQMMYSYVFTMKGLNPIDPPPTSRT